MCGIVGIVRSGNDDPTPVLRESMKRMTHRGPDDAGVWSEIHGPRKRPYCVGLGHVRLSILDLSAKGRQPMAGHGGRVISFNGEIYNYLELRETLKSCGHVFFTDTDTEVILAAHRQWGDDCVDRFVGMWAFALWDGEGLLLSRDRLGKKPLYIHQSRQAGLLAFASEIKGLQCIPGVPWRPDERTVFRYLAFAEMEREGRTFYQEIEELPAASNFRFSPATWQVRQRRFWSLPEQRADVDEKEAVETTGALLFDALRLRLRADTPVGLSLSGGLDSTLLLALMNEAGMTPPVFSSAYRQRGYNENRYLRLASARLRCRLHRTLSHASSFCENFESLIYHLDQPSKLPGPYSQWQVAAAAGGHVKVLLDGQGADELAGGYMYHFPVLWKDTPVAAKITALPDLLPTLWANRHVFRQYGPDLILERIRGRSAGSGLTALTPALAARFAAERPVWEDYNGLNEMLRRSIVDTSLPALLRYGDRINMAFGIENRCPYLDHRLVAYVSALPPQMKIRGGTTKWIFRQVARNRVPNAILHRRVKMGFPTPLGAWMRGELAAEIRARFAEYGRLALFRRWIAPGGPKRLLDEHTARRTDHQALLWRLLAVGAWLKTSEVGSGGEASMDGSRQG